MRLRRRPALLLVLVCAVCAAAPSSVPRAAAAADGSCYQPVDLYRPALEDGRPTTVTLTPDLVAAPIRIHNVLGIVEGRDGRHTDQLVVVGAHLDHDGIDEDGRIYHGADDNASGTAAVMAAAPAFAGYSVAPGLAAEVRRANAGMGLTLKEDYDVGAQDLLHRSDQWPFLQDGIPAVFLTTGLHPDYHTPSDEAARIDFGKLERVARRAPGAAWLVADGRRRASSGVDCRG